MRLFLFLALFTTMVHGEEIPPVFDHVAVFESKKYNNRMQYSGETFEYLENSHWKSTYDGWDIPVSYARTASRRNLYRGLREKNASTECFQFFKKFTDDALLMKQMRPLGVMLNMGYVTHEQVMALAKMTKELHASQIHFFDFYEGMDVKFRDLPVYEDAHKDKAVMWTVSNFGFDKNKKPILLELPVEKETKWFAPLKTRYKEIGCKYVYELGRVWSMSTEVMNKSLGFVSQYLKRESTSFSAKTEEVCVVFHSLDKLHTRAYRMRHPDRTIQGSNLEGESVFVVPLNEMLSKYPSNAL